MNDTFNWVVATLPVSDTFYHSSWRKWHLFSMPLTLIEHDKTAPHPYKQ